MSGGFRYIDFTGSYWPTERLDALLSDPRVRLVVEDGARIGAGSDGCRWSPFAVRAWAEQRYRRCEAAALLTLLVWRFFGLGCEPDLVGGAR